MANRKSHAVSLTQPSLRSLRGSPVRILTRSCSQNNASDAPPFEAKPLPASSLSTAALPRPTPPVPLQVTAPSVANNALEEQPATANSESAKHSQDEVCPPRSYSRNNSNVLIANVALPLMTAPRWFSAKYVVVGHTYTVLDSLLVVQKRPALNAIPVIPLCRRSRRSQPSVQPTRRPASQPRYPILPPTTTTSAVTTSTTTPTATPAPPNTALGEGNAPSATTLHDHCLCSMGDSCDRCRTVHPVAFATKAEVDALLQRVLDLEVCLKTEQIPAHAGPGLRRTK